MSAATNNARFLEGNSGLIPDPGNAGTISVGTAFDNQVNLTSAGAETRILAPPQVLGQQLTLTVVTLGGTITVALSGTNGWRTASFNGAQAAWASTAMSATGAYIFAKAVNSAGNILRWSLINSASAPGA